MGSESKNRNADGGGGGGEGEGAAQGIPVKSKKVVQSLKEIVNCTEQEIYAVLKECDMDPDRAVERLLAQDTFHEVKSKRERRKEMKEALDSRSRGRNVALSCGVKAGFECNVVQSGSTHVTYNVDKPVDKGEVGSVCPSVSSSTTCVTGENTYSDSFIADSARQSLGIGDSIIVSAEVCPGLQTSLLGVSKGHLSMADIVRMGRPSQDAVSHYNSRALGVSATGKSESSSSLPCQNHSEQPVFLDEWPVIEQPITGNSQSLNISSSSNSNGPFEHPSLNGTAVSLYRNCELDAAQVSQVDVASDNVISDKIGSSSLSRTVMSNGGLGSHSSYNLNNTDSSDFHSSYELHKVSGAGTRSPLFYSNHSDKLTSDDFVDVSSAASDFQQLIIRDSEVEVPSSEDNCTVVLPNHVQALATECSHLSFGSYNGDSNSESSVMLASNFSRNGLEEKAADVHGSSAQYFDASSVNHGDGQFRFDVLRETTGDKNYDFLSSPQQELVKHMVPEATLGHQYNTMPYVPDPSFLRSQWVTPSLPFNRPGLQSGNFCNFPRELNVDSNLIPVDMLAFLKSQLQPARYNKAVSSISNPAISMSEVAFAPPHRFALLQDLTVQSSTHLEPLADTRGYSSLAQNQPYMTAINSQQAFSGSTADMKYSHPQNRNEFVMSGLPPTGDAFGHGNLGPSSCNPGSFLSNPSFGRMPSSNYNKILPSQCTGASNLSSIQQGGSLSPWDYGAESRSSFLPESTRYIFPGQPSQAPPSQYTSPGYSDLYRSQTQVVDELQLPGGFQDLLSKQSHQFWQHRH